jgi:ribosomal protein S18 acetylase RimI-like enzyme
VNDAAATDALQIAAEPSLTIDDCRRLILHSEPWITLEYGEAEAARIASGSADDNLVVARLAGRVVGFALSTSGFLLGEYLKLLAVEPACRARGVGRGLMDALEACAFARWPNVYLCVSDFNRSARAFYQHLGYREVGALPDLFLPGKGEILMRKTIGAWRGFPRA